MHSPERATLETLRDTLIEALSQITEPAEHTRRYEAEYLPVAQALMRLEAEPTDVLLLTVGTQPYSVALSLVRTPPRIVYLVCTDETQDVGERALKLSGLEFEHVYRRRVGASDSAGVYQVLKEAWDRHRGDEVWVNFTSGTKAMTAGASTVAGFLNLRQLYIASERLPGKLTAFGREVVHEVEHPLVVFGEGQRREAERAFDEGRFDLARRNFQDLSAARVPGSHWGARAMLAEGYQAWERLDFEGAARALQGVLARLDRASRRMLPEEPLLFLRDRIANQAAAAYELRAVTGREARPAFDAGQTHGLVRALLARAERVARRAPDLAALVAYRALELCVQRRLAVHGLDAAAPEYQEPEALLAAYQAVCPPAFRGPGLPAPIALVQGRLLLRALGDEVIDQAAPSDEKFNGLLKARNQSIYAHGFRTLEAKALSGFFEVVRGIAAAVGAADGLDLPEGEDRIYGFVRLAD